MADSDQLNMIKFDGSTATSDVAMSVNRASSSTSVATNAYNEVLGGASASVASTVKTFMA